MKKDDTDSTKKKSSKESLQRTKKVFSGVLKKIPSKGEKSSSTSKANPKSLVPQSSGRFLPVIPIKEGVLFPSTESVLTFGRKRSLAALEAASKTHNAVVLVSQKDPQKNDPRPDDLYRIGTLVLIERKLKTGKQVNALVKGVSRVQIDRFMSREPYMTAYITKLDDIYDANKATEIQALASHLQKEFRKAVHIGKPVEFLNFMKLMGGVTDGELVDQIASTLDLDQKEEQELLETLDVRVRMEKVIDYLSKEIKVLEIEKDVASKTQQKFDKHMRESVLRERLKTIQKELGDIDDEEEVLNEYDVQLKKSKLSKDIHKRIKKEMKRLKQMSVNNPEAGYIRSWLDTVFELPWNKKTKTSVSLKKAATILDKNHHGLEEVKDRILEYMAVLEMKEQFQKKQSQKSKTKSSQVTAPTILCFVGPPGVGKTSIGKSIAETLGRKFVKISLGGVRDEAEIRGHRRTYVGAMPGRIISGMKQAESMNPVFMLDEIDKLSSDFRGDPSAALLEALDPEQNNAFEDHYLDMPFDLSEVLFITTANTLDTIPPALKDRLEIVRYSGYTQEEKLQIAEKHLVKKVLEKNGITPKQLIISKDSIELLIAQYSREAGVRELERLIGKLARKVARKLLETTKKSFKITPKLTTELLGPAPYNENLTEKKDQVGVATGLAWTSVGGEILFIEVALSPGKGKLQLTGKLGDVMKESAQAAMTYVKANAKTLGIDHKKIAAHDVHIHIPEGATPKDGPSAGITLTTALVSAFTNKAVKREVAMTGEVTLRGNVLKIGGLKEKSIAAHRAGSKLVLIPKDNQADLEKVPASVKKDITFKPVGTVAEVLKLALKK